MALLCWFDHSLVSRAEICKMLCWFFGRFKIPKRHSEIFWPLLSSTSSFSHDFVSLAGKNSDGSVNCMIDCTLASNY